MVRRLPVLQNRSAEDDDQPARSPSQWAVICGAFTFVFWIPLAMLGLAAAQHLAGLLGAGTALVMCLTLALALGPGLAGALLGRFGGRARERHALFGALGAAVAAWGLAVSRGALSPWQAPAWWSLLGLALLSGLAALVGAWLGRRARPRL